MSAGSIQELLALKKEKENLLSKIDQIQKVMASFQSENIKLKIEVEKFTQQHSSEYKQKRVSSLNLR